MKIFARAVSIIFGIAIAIIATVIFAIGSISAYSMLYMSSNETSGVYNSIINTIICETEKSCFHEIGHRKDDILDWPSMSPEFKLVVDNYINWCIEYEAQDYYCMFLIGFYGINGNDYKDTGWGGYSEVYAEIYEFSKYYGVSIPWAFVRYYEEGWQNDN